MYSSTQANGGRSQADTNGKLWRTAKGGNRYDQRTRIQNIIHIYNQNFSGPLDYAAAGQPSAPLGGQSARNLHSGAEPPMERGPDVGLRPEAGSCVSERLNSSKVTACSRQAPAQPTRAISKKQQLSRAQADNGSQEFVGSVPCEKSLPGVGETTELLKGLMKTSETTRQIYCFSKENISLLTFLEPDRGHGRLESGQEGEYPQAIGKNGGVELIGRPSHRPKTAITRLSVSLANALTDKYCRPPEDAAESSDLELTLAKMGKASIVDQGICLNGSNVQSNQLIEDYLKIAKSKIEKRKTPLLEFKYVESRPGSKATAGDGSKITLAYLKQSKLNKRELKALKKENKGYFHNQEFPLHENQSYSDDSSGSSVEARRENVSAVKNDSSSHIQAHRCAHAHHKCSHHHHDHGADSGSRQSIQSSYQSNLNVGREAGPTESITLQQANLPKSLQTQAIQQQAISGGGTSKKNRIPITNYSQFKIQDGSSAEQLQDFSRQKTAANDKETTGYGVREEDYIHEDEDSNDEIEKDDMERFAVSLKLTRDAKRKIQLEFQAMLKGQSLKSKRIKCLYNNCNRTFSSLYCLKRHFINVHKSVKRFKCIICGRGFSQRQYMMEHIYTHTKFNPYKCGIDGCQETFKQKSRLCIHRKQSHQCAYMVGSNAKKRPRPQDQKRQDEDEESLILDAADGGKDLRNGGDAARGADESEESGGSVTVSNDASESMPQTTNAADRRKVQKTRNPNIDTAADNTTKTKAQGGAQLDKNVCGLATNTFYISQVRQRKPPAGAATERKLTSGQAYHQEKGEQASPVRQGNLKSRGKSMVAGKTVGLSQDLQQRIARKQMAQDCLDGEIRAVLLKSSLSKSNEKSDHNLQALCQSMTANFQIAKSSRTHTLKNTEIGDRSQLLGAAEERQAAIQQLNNVITSLKASIEAGAAADSQRTQSNIKVLPFEQKASKPDKKRKNKAHQH